MVRITPEEFRERRELRVPFLVKRCFELERESLPAELVRRKFDELCSPEARERNACVLEAVRAYESAEISPTLFKVNALVGNSCQEIGVTKRSLVNAVQEGSLGMSLYSKRLVTSYRDGRPVLDYENVGGLVFRGSPITTTVVSKKGVREEKIPSSFFAQATFSEEFPPQELVIPEWLF